MYLIILLRFFFLAVTSSLSTTMNTPCQEETTSCCIEDWWIYDPRRRSMWEILLLPAPSYRPVNQHGWGTGCCCYVGTSLKGEGFVAVEQVCAETRSTKTLAWPGNRSATLVPSGMQTIFSYLSISQICNLRCSVLRRWERKEPCRGDSLA